MKHTGLALNRPVGRRRRAVIRRLPGTIVTLTIIVVAVQHFSPLRWHPQLGPSHRSSKRVNR